MKLGSATVGSNGLPKCGTADSNGNTFDLFGAYDCRRGPWALSAGLLAGRFPYITPSGVEDACPGFDSVQMIDGGYVENDGLGTLGDLGPMWQQIVASYNAEAIDSPVPTIVMPLVVYLDNGNGHDYELAGQDEGRTARRGKDGEDFRVGTGTTWPVESIPEILVPPWGYIFRPSRPDTLAQLSRDDGFVKAGWCAVSKCAALVESLAKALPNRTFFVHQEEQPSIGAPLGWVLSGTSMNDLDTDLESQAEKCAQQEVTHRAFPRYGSLRDLVNTLTGVDRGSGCS